VPNRKVLFDVALGPAAGGIVSLLMLLVGLLLSDQGSLFQCQLSFPGSILVGTLARVILVLLYRGLWLTSTPDGDWMAGLGDHGVELDARWAAGWGSVVQAIYGRSWADDGGDVNRAGDRVFGQSSRFVLGNCNCIFTTRFGASSLNELTEPDDARAALGLLVLS